MNIAIIGTGNMGEPLAALLAAAGNQITIGSRKADEAKEVAAKLGGNAQGASIEQALERGEVVILAIPYGAILELAAREATKKALRGKVVVDISNPLAADYMSLTVGHTTSAAEEIARELPGARVVKAFNTIFADVLRAKAQGQGLDVTAFCAGDDAQAKAQVLELVSQTGFSAVDAGALKNARYLEPLCELEIQLAYAQKLGTRIGFKLAGAAAKAKA
jgi:8-hydroxy-5-deazaflavin:NADPH oxidoreductase